MSYRQSLERTVKGMIQNFAPLGVIVALVSGVFAKVMVDRRWPDLGTPLAITYCIAIATLIAVVIFVVLAMVFALFPSSRESAHGGRESGSDAVSDDG